MKIIDYFKHSRGLKEQTEDKVFLKTKTVSLAKFGTAVVIWLYSFLIILIIYFSVIVPIVGPKILFEGKLWFFISAIAWFLFIYIVISIFFWWKEKRKEI